MQEASIAIIPVPVRDPQRAKEFYEPVLGSESSTIKS
ncbi:MAG: VOC family protein [Acidimicrobiales bacterium]